MPLLPQLSIAALLLCTSAIPAFAQDASPASPKANAPQTLAERTAKLRHLPGFLPLDWDSRNGKLLLEVPKPGTELLYTDSLPYGTGSNDLGLDRGQTAPARVVRFERQGNKVLLIEVNERFRSTATDPAEQLAARQSFPESVLWGFKLEAEAPDGGLLVDATDFFLRDVHGVAEALASTKQGTYKVDASRSAIAMDMTKVFPRNTEVEAILTFTTEGEPLGKYVRDVTPDPHAVTVRERQSFIALPEPGFVSRAYDPRSGYFDLSHRDYAAPLGEDLDQRLIERHRLQKKDPGCRENCEPVEPIVYYVDRGAPEPVRSALVEGARWWNQAFTAAGWHDAFRVEVLPEGADPMDVRYNIIQWVHRYTRGWSYGATVTDPRTGEILKGNVTLGSLRGRQDYLIAEGLLAPYKSGKAPDAEHDPMLAMVLARIRQLAAHETGHTLGLAHNFAASSFAQSTSVMDYPHPYITLDAQGRPDLTHAYAVNIGEWDKVAIDYGYRQFAPAVSGTSEHAALNRILRAAESKGLPYITDQDARPLGSAHPKAHLWDNGSDAAAELDRVLDIRAVALKRFGPDVLRDGTPMAQMAETLVPIYLLHRYQTEAACKEIGGLDYEYNLRGDGQADPVPVSPEAQRHALASVLRTLTPEVLTLPESLLAQIPPQPPGYPRTQESLPAQTGLAFDPIAAAQASADLTFALLFEPSRASRLVLEHARDPHVPGLQEVIAQTVNTLLQRPQGGGLDTAVSRAIESRGLEQLMALAVNPAASPEARAIARAQVLDVKTRMGTGPSEEAAFRDAMSARIEQFEREPDRFMIAKPLEAPPGMPIGDDEEM